MQSQVRFNRVPEKVPEKGWEALVQSQVRFSRVPEKVPECSREGSAEVFSAVGFAVQRLASQHASERCVKIKRLLGIPQKLFFLS